MAKSENPNTVTQFDDDIQFAFLLANHDPASKLLIQELELLERHDVNFIVSNFMGYGIYHQSVYSYSDLTEVFTRQIHEV